MISIIIPAYNEESYIESTLKSIENQNYKDYEVIVVCNGCTDNTEKIAKKYSKVISLKEKGVSKARNEGAKLSKGNRLVFLDADTKLNNDTLEKISKINSFGTCKVLPNNNLIKHRIAYNFKNLLTFLGSSNGIIFCDKNLFQKVNGFPLQSRGEDRQFILSSMKHSKFKIADSYVIHSTRRFDKWGYLKVAVFWAKEFFNPTNKEYEAIR